MKKAITYEWVRHVPYRDAGTADAYAGERCRLDVYHPAGQPGFSTVVWFHGGGLNSGERHVPDGLKEQGFAVVPVDYRLSPRASAPAYIEDAAEAVAWTFRHIGQWGGDPDRIFIAGASAGAYLASLIVLDRRWLAACGADAYRVKGLISLTGQMITHFTVRQERAIPEWRALVDDYAPLYHVRSDAPPILLVTGDRNLELFGRYEENAFFHRMMKIAGHQELELHELPGLDHGAVENAAIPYLVSFVQKRSS